MIILKDVNKYGNDDGSEYVMKTRICDWKLQWLELNIALK